MSLADFLTHQTDILDILYDGVVVVDQDGKVIYVNPANERITGIPPEQALGRYVTDVVPDSSLLEVLRTGEAQVGVRTKVGDKEIISNIVPIKKGGRILGGVSVFRDITEMINLSRELEKAQEMIRHLAVELKVTRGEDKGIVIGKNPQVQRLFQLALKAAAVSSNVLIRGESGTGKEVLARFIHDHSPRRHKPFIAVNCAAIPENLLESELFGYEEGAFTGARKGGKPGLFEVAGGGTIFLDEIGDMGLKLQARLLRVLQDREVKRLGGTETRRVDTRIIAATNQNLEDLLEKGQFRQDLYYRLNVISFHLPPLRERKEDIPALIGSFLRKLKERVGKEVKFIRPEALQLLLAYDYPGNIRELENIIEQAVVMSDSPTIGVEQLPPFLTRKGGEEEFCLTFPRGFPLLEEVEREVLKKALASFREKTAVARALGISRATLYRKLARYGLRDSDAK